VVDSIHRDLASPQDCELASTLLSIWRTEGPDAVLAFAPSTCDLGPLVQEVLHRATASEGPRLLVDGLWFSRPYGGVTRVWQQILHTWSLPGLIHPLAPVACLEHESHLALSSCLHQLESPLVDPLDPSAILASSSRNAEAVRAWGADVFLSSWTSCSGLHHPTCPELALVHDCLPERSYSASHLLRLCRRRWLLGASSHLAVSSATARDLEQLLTRAHGTIFWCHPSGSEIADNTAEGLVSLDSLWHDYSLKAGVTHPFILLPGTSKIGSYKNPELVARALLEPGLQSLQLVISGLNAAEYASSIDSEWPALAARVLAIGCTDLQLAQLYRHALAVLMPSRVEGFGLPVIEALRQHATVLVADSPGLREAGGCAVPRVNPDDPRDLASWLRLFLDPSSSRWINLHLQRRRQERLSALPSVDLIGISLLAMARQLWLKSGAKTQPCL